MSEEKENKKTQISETSEIDEEQQIVSEEDEEQLLMKANPNARWYVLRILSGQEMKVKRYIDSSIPEKGFENLILKVFIPVEDMMEMVQGKKKTIQKKFFPGYILILMEVTKITKAFIRSVPGVTGFITTGDTPVPLSDDEIKAIVQRTKKEKAVQQMAVPFVEGESVRVIDGPFKDFTGVISEVNQERGKVKIMVSIFGRLTPVDVDFMQLKKDKK